MCKLRKYAEFFTKILLGKKTIQRQRTNAKDHFAFGQRLACQTYELCRKSLDNKSPLKKKLFSLNDTCAKLRKVSNPSTEGDFVLGPAPGRPNVQTLSLEPGPG
jgi:hypothetical protein